MLKRLDFFSKLCYNGVCNIFVTQLKLYFNNNFLHTKKVWKRKEWKVLTEKIRKIKSVFSEKDLLTLIIEKLSEIKLKNLKGVAFLTHLFILFSLLFVLDVQVGYKVTANNKSYGVVATSKEAKIALEDAMNTIKSSKGKDYKFSYAGCSIVLTKKDNIISPNEAKNNIVSALDGLSPAYAVYVDKEVAVALKSEKDAKDILNSIKAKYKTQDNEVSFYNNVYVKEARVKKNVIKDKNDAEKILNGEKTKALTHEVKEGETIGEIAESYKITQEEILKNNPTIIPELLKVGTKLCIKAPVSLILVKSVSKETCQEQIPFETKVKNDSTRYQGTTVVSVNGVNGVKNVVYENVKVNGVLTQRNPISEEIVSNPVTKVVLSGTKPKPKNAPTGTFLRPYYGTVTSRYGSRWGRQHQGVDIGGTTGDPIKASDGGTVTYAGWNGGYGNFIKIKHDNGYETYYGHLSSIGVSVGQKVAQGEVIGKLGNTGRSTGPHLHFEIRKNGVPCDPLKYTNWFKSQ